MGSYYAGQSITVEQMNEITHMDWFISQFVTIKETMEVGKFIERMCAADNIAQHVLSEIIEQV